METKYSKLLKNEDILQILSNLGFSLETKGKNFFMLCPFHDDKNPSLQFVPDKNFFKCFSCDFKAGDIFKFWAQYKKVTFMQAMKEISKLGYFELSNKIKEKEDEKKNKKNGFLSLISLVKNIYQHNLFTLAGKSILTYFLEKRKINEGTIEKFSLGGTILNKQLTNIFLNEKNSLFRKDLLLTNLIQITSNNQAYDFFRSQQLIIPLENEKGEVVAFASRKINNLLENKYIYLSNNPYYQKSSLLYNYYSVKKNQEKECYLVEGFFDVISLNQVGIDNCLAILGTSLSDYQLELLQKLEKKIILFLDGDKAGRQATINISILLLRKNIDCEIISYDYNHDPDEICLNEGNKLEKILQERKNPYLFIIHHYFKKEKIQENPQRVSYFIAEISQIFANSKQNVSNFLIENISSLVEWSKDEVKNIFFSNLSFPKKKPTSNIVILSNISNPIEKIQEKEREMIELCALDRKFWLFFQQRDNNYFFLGKKERNSYQIIHNFYTSSLDHLYYKKKDHGNDIAQKQSIHDLYREVWLYWKIYQQYKQQKICKT